MVVGGCSRNDGLFQGGGGFLHQGSAFSPFLFSMVMDSLMDEIRQECPWTMIYSDDV